MEPTRMTMRPTDKLSRYRRYHGRCHTMPIETAARRVAMEAERAEMERALREHEAKVAAGFKTDQSRKPNPLSTSDFPTKVI